MKNNKDYHKTNIHKRMLRNIALNVELLLNEGYNSISEYETQAFAALFLRRNFINLPFKIAKERFGKVDFIITDKKDIPVILYEMKLFIKKTKKIAAPTSESQIRKDFIKLCKTMYEYKKARGYFILILRKNHYQENRSKYKFLKPLFSKKRKNIVPKLEQNELPFEIRPSSKVKIENTFVMSFEVKLNR